MPVNGLPTVLELAAALAEGKTTSRRLVEAALGRIADPSGEGARAFRRAVPEEALADADRADALRKRGYVASPLAGLPVSIKDLFDIAGQVTAAGSKVLADAPPAAADATAVARLRAAGAVLIGRTNMTEFAFSGVGLNPHHGTPGNPADRNRIPGGSSSGAAVSVADRMAVVGLGTDTGGSVRIPAAYCGIAGFKPTARRVPLDGCLPLSFSLDSIGPLAPSVACCTIADSVLAGEPVRLPRRIPVKGLRLAVVTSLFMEGLDAEVAEDFARARATLAAAGAQFVELAAPELGQYLEASAAGGFAAAEAFAWHRKLLAEKGNGYDPRVAVRIRRGGAITAADYIDLFAARRRIAGAFWERVANFDAVAVPTVALVPPKQAALAADEDYARLNVLSLRNTSAGNFLDCCGVTVPCHRAGGLPVGFMLMGPPGADRRLLDAAQAVEMALERGVAA
jgi:aspartyl-tRNA(Asn)/glutamyl-tRNA(Gln) amidotransferase subunit A